MQLNKSFSTALLAMGVLTTFASASPVPCTDLKRDLILRGQLSPEACCPYGYCRNDVVVSMGTKDDRLASGIRYNDN